LPDCTSTAADNASRYLLVLQVDRGVGGVAVTVARFGVDPWIVATAILTRTT